MLRSRNAFTLYDEVRLLPDPVLTGMDTPTYRDLRDQPLSSRLEPAVTCHRKDSLPVLSQPVIAPLPRTLRQVPEAPTPTQSPRGLARIQLISQ
jgi:hypothetical protein